jgi:hypothetical protein
MTYTLMFYDATGCILIDDKVGMAHMLHEKCEDEYVQTVKYSLLLKLLNK